MRSRKRLPKIAQTPPENNTMAFPQIIGILIDAGFESYAVDFRRETATY